MFTHHQQQRYNTRKVFSQRKTELFSFAVLYQVTIDIRIVVFTYNRELWLSSSLLCSLHWPYKKSQRGYISHISGEFPTQPNSTKIGVWVEVYNVINLAKFGCDRSKEYKVAKDSAQIYKEDKNMEDKSYDDRLKYLGLWTLKGRRYIDSIWLNYLTYLRDYVMSEFSCIR